MLYLYITKTKYLTRHKTVHAERIWSKIMDPDDRNDKLSSEQIKVVYVLVVEGDWQFTGQLSLPRHIHENCHTQVNIHLVTTGTSLVSIKTPPSGHHLNCQSIFWEHVEDNQYPDTNVNGLDLVNNNNNNKSGQKGSIFQCGSFIRTRLDLRSPCIILYMY